MQQTEDKTGENSAFKKLILLAFVVLFCFILLEILVRFFFPVSDAIWMGDGTIGHKHIINKSGIYVIPEHISYVKFNGEGFRDVDHNVSDKYKIAMLGDSFVDALEVNFNDTFYQKLQNKLDNLYPGKYEIFNFGLYYFSTAQEYLLYNKFVKKYNPDEIYLFVFVNDPYETCLEDPKNPTYYIDDEGNVQARKFYPNEYNSIQLFVSKYFKSAVFIRKVLQDAKSRVYQEKIKKLNYGLPAYAKSFLKEYDNQTAECWNLSRYFLRKLNEETTKSGTKIIAVIIPPPASLYKQDAEKLIKSSTLNESSFDFDKPSRMFKDIFNQERITYYDLEPDLKMENKRLYYNIDGHFNPVGHEVVSEALFQKLINASL